MEKSKNVFKERKVIMVLVLLIVLLAGVSVYAYNKNDEYKLNMQNQYNMAFYEVLAYVKNIQSYLLKAQISASPESAAESLTQVWREANLASAFLSQLPLSTEEVSKTEKYLNQVSDYSYSLSIKTINGETLEKEDFKNLKELHSYSESLLNTLNQISVDLNNGNIKWEDFYKKEGSMLSKDVSNVSKDSFANIEDNFEKYEGLIYDGAFSEHMTNAKRVGLVGKDVTEEEAKEKVYKYFEDKEVEEVVLNGFIENGNIPSYDFNVKLKNNVDDASIAISKKGGQLVYMNYNRDVNDENIKEKEAVKKGKEYLEKNGYSSMIDSYHLKQNGIMTINYAYQQEDVVIYSDLIKVKVALDNGEILGVETAGYLNSHMERELSKPKISLEKAKASLNPEIEVLSEGMAMIPTLWKTEILCYEFKGKIEDTNFLVYTNVETGKEEDILVIVDTPNGTLTL